VTEKRTQGDWNCRGATVDGFWIASVEYRGFQECPFENNAGTRCERFRYAHSDYSIENLDTKRAIHFPGLIIHLVDDHHFFEGSVTYRLEPADAIDTLALKPVDSRAVYRTEKCWVPVMATGDPHDKVSIEDAREMVEVAPGIRIYSKGERCVLIAEREHVLDAPLVFDGLPLLRAQRIRRGTYVYARGENTYVVYPR
jgi:hypothetical protein